MSFNKVGYKYKNFIVTKYLPIDEIKCELIELEHEILGSKVIKIRNEDAGVNIVRFDSDLVSAAIRVRSNGIIFNNGQDDFNFTLRKESSGSAIVYDAGNDLLNINSDVNSTNFFLFQNPLAELYLHDTSADYAIGEAGVYKQITNMLSGVKTGNNDYINVLPTNASYTIGAKGGGFYFVNASLTFTGTLNSEYSNHSFGISLIISTSVSK